MRVLFSKICGTFFGVFFLIFVIIQFCCKSIFKIWSRKNIFYIKPDFIYGNFEHSLNPKVRLAEVIHGWYNKFKAQGLEYIGAYHYLRPVLVVLDIKMVQNVLQNDFKHFSARYAYGNLKNDPLSCHFLNLHGDKWKYIRSKISPMTTTSKVRSMFSIFLESSKELEHCLDTKVNFRKPIEIRKISSLYTADVILSYAFGINSNSFQNPENSIHQFGEMFFKKGSPITTFLIKFFPEISRALGIKLTNKETELFFKTFVKDLIDHRENEQIFRNDMLQMMINLKEEKILTLDEITAQLFGIFLAGYETSSGAIAHCLYELSRNLEIQERARNEITTILEKYQGEITYEGISAMKYLEKTILETLRKHPPLDYLARRVTEDYKIPGTDVVLEKGLGVYIPIIAIHYDPEFYPNPNKFVPERFLEENVRRRPDCSYLAFSEGPRICTGHKMGLVQTKVGLIRLLKNYRFTPNERTKDPLVIKTRPVPRIVDGGIWLNAERL